MKTLVLGDVEGVNQKADEIIKSVNLQHPDLKRVIQVGDMGFGYPGCTPWLTDHEGLDQKWICGNHENYDLLFNRHLPNFDADPYHTKVSQWRQMLDVWQYMPRGTIEDGILYIGGAMSPPWFIREAVEGVDWWSQEQVTKKDLEAVRKAVSEYDPKNIHTVISHDCPLSFGVEDKLTGLSWSSETRDYLEEIRKMVMPTNWYFGHYHFKHKGTFEGCRWRCLNQIKWGNHLDWNDQDFEIVDLPL